MQRLKSKSARAAAPVFFAVAAVWLCASNGIDFQAIAAEAPPLPGRVVWKADQTPMALVPAGAFPMGGGKQECEKPRHTVTLPAYYIDTYEVTWGRYLKFCEETGRSVPFGGPPAETRDRLPVANVKWEDADAYCRWAGKKLPDEAQWEKACAGEKGQIYPWGNGWNGSACVNRTNSDSAQPIGSKPQCISAFGVFDIAGNVWEWTDGWYKSYPGNGFAFDSTGETRVVRGGAFFYSIDLLQCQTRWGLPPDDASDHGGFRCAAVPGPDFKEKVEIK